MAYSLLFAQIPSCSTLPLGESYVTPHLSMMIQTIECLSQREHSIGNLRTCFRHSTVLTIHPCLKRHSLVIPRLHYVLVY